MDTPAAIELQDVVLMLPIFRARRQVPVEGETGEEGQWVGGRVNRRGRGRLLVTALNGLTLKIPRGDRVALIGHNGAGKSSLLRLMAGIYFPTSGSCTVHGVITTLFTKFLGVNANATGLENIVLSGLTLGMTRAQIDEMLPEIVEFAELSDFLHMPVRTYSAGMRMRLGFSVATSLRPDVLLIDEVFGTGDRRFRRKARERLETMLGGANTLVMASHSYELNRRFCTSALWIENGKIRRYGPVSDVLKEFKHREDQDRTKQTSAGS